jgi:opacity protein-like surface antigen
MPRLARLFKLKWTGLLLLFFFAGRSPAQSPAPLQKSPVASEISVIYGHTAGNIQIFGAAGDRQLEILGVQYARNSWGGLFTARVDYLAEVLPMTLLFEPKVYSVNSTALSAARKTVYGADVKPIGVRLLWRRDERFKPYLLSTGGVVYFTDRVLSTEGAHLNFSAEFGAGVQYTLHDRSEFRLGYSLYHISNGNIARHNPGLDTNMIYAAWCFDLRGRQRRAQ